MTDTRGTIAPRSMAAVALLLLAAACAGPVDAPATEAPAVGAPVVEAPAVEPPAVEVPATEPPAVEAPAAGTGSAAASSEPSTEGPAAVLTVSVMLDADGRARSEPQLFWVHGPSAAAAGLTPDPAEGTARLFDDDGSLLADGPVHRFESMPDCGPDADCSPQAGVRTMLVVPADAETAARLELEVDGEVLVSIQRSGDVEFLQLDAPPAGELVPPAVVSWQASGGEVAARLLPAGTDPGTSSGTSGARSLLLDGASDGRLEIRAEDLYPGDGAMLELVAMDGLAFDRAVVGPYRSGVPLETDWMVVVDGEPMEELDPIVHDPQRSAYLLRQVEVVVRPPGEDWSSGHHDVQARWVSDRDGDLAPHNLDPAPDLYVPSSVLSPGRHALTLELEVETARGPARHEARLELDVLEP